MPDLTDSELLPVGILLFVIVYLVVLAFGDDNTALLTPAGVIAFLLSFQVWTLTANLPATLSVVTLGVTLMALSLARLASIRAATGSGD